MSGMVAYSGRISDHLYRDCPALARWKDSPYGSPRLGKRLNGLVDPDGTDICVLCWNTFDQRRKAAQNPR